MSFVAITIDRLFYCAALALIDEKFYHLKIGDGDGPAILKGLKARFTMVMLGILSLLLLLVSTEGMYFLVSSKRKCFNVEQPRDTPIVFAYELMDTHAVVTLSLYYGHLAMPDMKIRTISIESEGPNHLDFVADNDGYYSLCLEQNGSHKEKSRFKLLINYGYDSEYYEKLSNFQIFSEAMQMILSADSPDSEDLNDQNFLEIY